MKKLIFSLLFLFIMMAQARADTPDNAPPPQEDPITAFMQSASAGSPQLISKHKDFQNYFNQFIPLWKDLLQRLATQQEPAGGLEAVFKNDHDIVAKASPSIQKLKPPSDLKDFQEALTKGMDALGDWCFGMSDRIHYATSDYQKEAYTKRIEAFKSDWFDEFFEPALMELKDGWSEFKVYHWMDDLTPEQEKIVRHDRSTERYLRDFNKIAFNHLKNVAAAERKLREAENDSDNTDAFISDLQKEENDINKTVSKLQKISPPAGFQDFHALQIQWLQGVAQETQKLIDYQTAVKNHAPDDKLQLLMYERNTLNQQSNDLRVNLDAAYAAALANLAPTKK